MLSRVIYTGVTGTTFSYAGVPLLDDRLVTEQSQLVVTVNGVKQDYVSGAPGAGEYTLDKNTKILTLGTALSASDTLRIVRQTKSDGLHVVFTNTAALSAEDLNLVLKQLLYLDQERQDDIQELP